MGMTRGQEQAERGHQQRYGFSGHQRQAVLGASDEPGERLIGVFSSENDKWGPSGLIGTAKTKPRTSTVLPTPMRREASVRLNGFING